MVSIPGPSLRCEECVSESRGFEVTKVANRRQEILNKAREMFSQRSYHAVSLEEISRALGMGKSTMYHYFSTKEELFTEVLKENVKELYEYVCSKVDAGQGFQEKVYLLVKAVLEHFEDNRETFLLLLRERLDFLNLGQLRERLETTFRAEYDQFMNHFREMVAQGRQSGEVVDLDPSIVIASIFGTINAAALAVIVHHPERKLTEIVDDCYQVIVHGVVADQK